MGPAMEDALVAVLREDLRSQFKAFGESLEETRDSLRADIHATRAELGEKVDAVSSDVAELNSRMKRVEKHMNGAPRGRPA